MEANVRIDKGIKRGPKVQARPGPGKLARNPETGHIVKLIPDDLDPNTVLQRYLTEETTSQIAASYGVSRKTLTAWLREKQPDQWKRVQIIRALDMKDKGNDGLEVADDALSLARSREIVKSAQWELQALDKDYQPKQQVSVDLTVDLGDRLRDARDRIRTIVQDAPLIIENSKKP
jgi:hypothetical protein